MSACISIAFSDCPFLKPFFLLSQLGSLYMNCEIHGSLVSMVVELGWGFLDHFVKSMNFLKIIFTAVKYLGD